jgi:hypothetical protein
MKRLRAARQEVAKKSDRQIELETAQKWAARALACFERAAKTSGAAAVEWKRRAEDYRHEALEHAALMQDGGKTVGVLERELNRVVRRKRN